MKLSLTRLMLMGAMTIATMAVQATPINQAALSPTHLSTVKHALQAKDNTKVLLKGKVIRALGDEKYQFQDETGKITVEIDDELWQGHTVSDQQVISLLGEVDIDYKPTKRVEIDVEQITF